MGTARILSHSHSAIDGNNIQQMETAILDHHIMIKNLADRVKISGRGGSDGDGGVTFENINEPVHMQKLSAHFSKRKPESIAHMNIWPCAKKTKGNILPN